MWPKELSAWPPGSSPFWGKEGVRHVVRHQEPACAHAEKGLGTLGKGQVQPHTVFLCPSPLRRAWCPTQQKQGLVPKSAFRVSEVFQHPAHIKSLIPSGISEAPFQRRPALVCCRLTVKCFHELLCLDTVLVFYRCTRTHMYTHRHTCRYTHRPT